MSFRNKPLDESREICKLAMSHMVDHAINDDRSVTLRIGMGEVNCKTLYEAEKAFEKGVRK